MARAHGTYSRLIALLKVLLPLAALGLLSTMFLLSTPSDPGDPIVIGAEDGAGDRQEGVEAPFFSGTTEGGDAITLAAASARPLGDGVVTAERVQASLRLSDGGVITLSSGQARLQDDAQTVDLIGGVEIANSTGYRITTGTLSTSLNEIRADTGGPVKGEGPPGVFSAGRLQIRSDDDGAVQMLFTKGIRMVYDPQQE